MLLLIRWDVPFADGDSRGPLQLGDPTQTYKKPCKVISAEDIFGCEWIEDHPGASRGAFATAWNDLGKEAQQVGLFSAYETFIR